MENLTGGTPPVRPLPCVVPCKLYFGTVKDSALLDGYLTLDDLKRIQAALDFLLPVFPAEREAQKIFRAAILKTKAMLKRKT